MNASSDEKDEIRYVADLSGSCIQGMQVHSTHCCVRGAVQYGQVCCFQLLCNKHVSFTLTSTSVCALTSCFPRKQTHYIIPFDHQLATLIQSSTWYILVLRPFNSKQVRDHL